MWHIVKQNSIITGLLVVCCGGFILSGCSTVSKKSGSYKTTQKRGGGYYLDDGPGDNIPDNLDQIPNAVPKVEKIASGPSRPYTVMGTTYAPMTALNYYKEQGVGSWYGKKFHGMKTSSGETYDMFGMTAAHPTLPIPSYARVTSLENGKQVIVRVNDRGPFLNGRLIDLTYTAAYKLGYVNKGSGPVEVELLLPDEIARIRNGEILPDTNTVATKPISAFKFSQTQKKTISHSQTASSANDSMPTAITSGYYIQFGAYHDMSNAKTYQMRYGESWASHYPDIKIISMAGFYKLMAGPFSTRNAALLARQDMQEKGIEGFILKI